MMPLPTEHRSKHLTTGWLLVVCGLIGSASAVTLLIEKIALLKDPSYIPTCSMNPILSCGSIMNTPQAEVFGFPNPILGVFGFAVITTLGAVLLAGADPQPWLWAGLQVGATAGVVFVHWLIFQSLYVIGALCPYCMIVWVITIIIFTITTAHWTRNRPRARVFNTYAPTLTTAWLLLITTLIAIRFWDYWITTLPGG
ncbi:MAG: vitamin K epoxide reductase family protein [Ornithinimicrobium sp.]